MHHGWEGHTGVTMINVHLSFIALAIALPIRTKGGKVMPLGLSSLFEMHPASMHEDLVAGLCTLGSGGTTWMQTDPHPLVLSSCISFENIGLFDTHSRDEFFIPWKPCPPWYSAVKSPAGILQ